MSPNRPVGRWSGCWKWGNDSRRVTIYVPREVFFCLLFQSLRPNLLVVSFITRSRVPAPARPATPGIRPAAGVLPVLGAALAFVGREVVPRVVAALLEKRERRRTQLATGASPRSIGGGRRYRWRRQGRR